MHTGCVTHQSKQHAHWLCLAFKQAASEVALLGVRAGLNKDPLVFVLGFLGCAPCLPGSRSLVLFDGVQLAQASEAQPGCCCLLTDLDPSLQLPCC